MMPASALTTFVAPGKTGRDSARPTSGIDSPEVPRTIAAWGEEELEDETSPAHSYADAVKEPLDIQLLPPLSNMGSTQKHLLYCAVLRDVSEANRRSEHS